MTSRAGSSPLARGLPPGPPPPARRLGIIPARAGFTATRPMTPSSPTDHPRSRGVYCGQVTDGGRAGGSSPLARGLLSGPGRLPGSPRIIPARAGFTDPGLAGPAGPHGSSPLARGLLALRTPQAAAAGIIPARAGFTSAEDRRTNELADHPRSRGVYWMSRSRLGSSLLVWCSFGQVVMGGRAGRLLTPSVLLSAWSMSVRRRSEAWDR